LFFPVLRYAKVPTQVSAIPRVSMGSIDSSNRSLTPVARDYFAYLGTNLPQQCASDEFYFLPRAEAAREHLGAIDDLRPEKIDDHLRYVETLVQELSSLEGPRSLEEEADRSLLEQSMKGFIREFKHAEVWRTDPTLYVKIPLFATDRILSRGDGAPDDRTEEDFFTVFGQIPSFLKQAMRNLSSPSEIGLRVAYDMALDALQFFNRDLEPFLLDVLGAGQELLLRYEKAVAAWDQFRRELARLPTKGSFAIGADGLREIFDLSLGYQKSPDEILDVAQRAYDAVERKLNELAKKIDNTKTWNRIIYEGSPSTSSAPGLLRLFEGEVERLRDFLSSKEVLTFPSKEVLLVRETPLYLKSLRATASYRAPLTGDTGGPGIFYITPLQNDLEIISAHCPYLSAHETYPGHHLLDHHRVHHPNPIRRQVESPLFYEGWACYSEQLLDELGYTNQPRQHLIQLKRQLWRTLRAVLDVKLQTERIGLMEAAREIENLGFSPERAQRQVRRFALTPGYQSCYFIGSHEILRLRDQYAPQLGIKIFHDTLLEGGQIPFHLAERRLQERISGND
jgi:hypothetical protein